MPLLNQFNEAFTLPMLPDYQLSVPPIQLALLTSCALQMYTYY